MWGRGGAGEGPWVGAFCRRADGAGCVPHVWLAPCSSPAHGDVSAEEKLAASFPVELQFSLEGEESICWHS